MNIFGEQASARKAFFAGAHRTRPPEETLRENRRFMPAMGITRLANVTGLDRIGLPVCVAVRPNSRALSTSQGKGETIEAAKASALMEAIESWHCERVAAPVYVESYRELAGARRVVDVTQLGIRADATLHLDRPMEWIEAEELFSSEPICVPLESVSTNFVEMPGSHPTFIKSSNGLASGNHILEALVHGLLEVIERDAVSLWTLVPASQKKQQQVDLSTIRDLSMMRVLETLARCGIVLGVWDITTDIGIPAFTCTILEDPESAQWRPIPAFSGHGCHLSPEIALSRAVHEAIQSRVTVISGSRDDMFPRDYRNAGSRVDHANTIASLRDPVPTLPFCCERCPVSEYFETDLATILTQLSRRGIDTAVAVDLRRPEIAIPVVKVVVPGLEPFHTSLYRPGKRAALMRASNGSAASARPIERKPSGVLQ